MEYCYGKLTQRIPGTAVPTATRVAWSQYRRVKIILESEALTRFVVARLTYDDLLLISG